MQHISGYKIIQGAIGYSVASPVGAAKSGMKRMSWLLFTFGRGREATKDLGEVTRQGKEGETENLEKPAKLAAKIDFCRG